MSINLTTLPLKINLRRELQMATHTRRIGGSMSIQKSFVRFIIVGVIATVVQYMILSALVWGLDMGPTGASAIGYVCSTFVNYALNRTLTFESSRAHIEAIPRFLMVAGFGLAFNTMIMWTMTVATHHHFLISQVVATTLVLIWNFTINRAWTFAPRHVEHDH
jgi:putative flippase GtrA